MPTPLDNIREGLETGNWTLINDGYLALTGINILGEIEEPKKAIRKKAAPKKTVAKKTPKRPAKATKPKQAAKPRATRKKAPTVVVEPQRDPNDFSMPLGIPQRGESEKVQAKLEQVSLRKKNGFIDDRIDFNTERKMSKQPKTSRTGPARPPIRSLVINCTRCSRPQQVMENELIEEVAYICRDCLKGIYHNRR